MAFTNKDLVTHAQKALSENWGYCLGSFGNVLTDAFLKQKCSQGSGVGTYNTSHKDYLLKFMNKRVTDCYGLVKSYLWWNGGNVQYKSTQDRNQETAFNIAKEKGLLNTMPEIPGLVLWMKGHAGVYIGNRDFIECAGAPTGMRKGRIENGKVVSGSRFTHWFKDSYITYEEPKKTTEPDKGYVNFCVDGSSSQIRADNIDGRFVAKLSELSRVMPDVQIPVRVALEQAGYKVLWEESSRTISGVKA